MGLGIGRAIESFRSKVHETLRLPDLNPARIKADIEQKAQIAQKFLPPPINNLSSLHASRTGISTALNPFTLGRRENASGDKQFDGFFVGANKQTFSPETNLSDIPAVTPKNGVTNSETLLYVNGIRTKVDGQAQSLQAIADRTGSRVIGVHNSTESFVGDILQTFGDKMDIGKNPAADTIADTVYGEIKAGRSVHLMAHSQGAAITSRALQDVKTRLMLEDGMSARRAEALMKNVKVETFGGASTSFPDGPQYVHYVNRNDGVPQFVGLRSGNILQNPGRGAVTHYFREGKPLVSHGFEKFYLPERVPFEQARQGRFN